ncbi:hypothetical protein BD779DRAFT_1473775 [Infundibulicybe gibba]|nr:hypothetical protein BD779DRAFT_1473775 [Infundibulicybe gibba]
MKACSVSRLNPASQNLTSTLLELSASQQPVYWWATIFYGFAMLRLHANVFETRGNEIIPDQAFGIIFGLLERIVLARRRLQVAETLMFNFSYYLNNSGPIFVGVILNWVLLCCLTVQVYIYYVSSKKDRIGLKFLVCFLFLVDIAQTGVVTTIAWDILVVSSILELSTRDSGAAEQALPIINGTIFLMVLCNMRRIWFLNRTVTGRMLSVLISVAWLAGNLLVDILITSTLWYSLHKAQRQSLSKGAETILSRLMVNTIETGAVTVVAAGIGLGLFASGAGGFANVCLANLNVRTWTRRLGDNTQFRSATRAGEDGSGRANTTLRFAMRSTNLTQSRANPEDNTEIGVGLRGVISNVGFEVNSITIFH